MISSNIMKAQLVIDVHSHMIPQSYLDYLSDPETIRELLTITSPSHLLYGTDYPYVKAPILIRNLSALKNNLQEIVPQDVDQVLQENAVKLFNK